MLNFTFTLCVTNLCKSLSTATGKGSISVLTVLSTWINFFTFVNVYMVHRIIIER